MNLEITEPAQQDFNDILQYGHDTYGERRARDYAASIYSKLYALCDFPNLGHSRNDIPAAYKALRVGDAHIAIYRLDSETVFILRILYHTSDFAQQEIH
jgi:plasmid stabilization system protein ParE